VTQFSAPTGAGPHDAVLVDARSNLAGARSLCQLVHSEVCRACAGVDGSRYVHPVPALRDLSRSVTSAIMEWGCGRDCLLRCDSWVPAAARGAAWDCSRGDVGRCRDTRRAPRRQDEPVAASRGAG
jgi:hypothetical protein